MNKFGKSGFGLTPSQSVGGKIPIWLNPKDLQKYVGGFTVANPPAASVVIPGGTLLEVDEDAKTAKVCYRLEIYEDAAASPYKVKKNYGVVYDTMVAVGANLMKVPATPTGTGAAYAITDIDTSNADYDVVTTATTLGSVVAGDVLGEAAGTAASGIALEAVPNAISYADNYVQEDGLTYTCAGVYFGEIYHRRIRKVTDMEKALLPQIKFSESK